MANIFLSYNRQSESIVRKLADDLEALDHTVWFDRELSGGQVWWDQILATIRESDVFVFILDPKALASTACKRELSYAADLGKPIVPILVSDEVSINLLPSVLSHIQFVDYRRLDRDAAFHLARAIAAVPSPPPFPDPLPPPPETPVSYLGSLTEQVQSTSTLSFEQQSALVVNLKKYLSDPDTSNDTRILLERLRNRRDLFAAIAEEIDDLLVSSRQASNVFSRDSDTELFSGKRSQKKDRPTTKPPQNGETKSNINGNYVKTIIWFLIPVIILLLHYLTQDTFYQRSYSDYEHLGKPDAIDRALQTFYEDRTFDISIYLLSIIITTFILPTSLVLRRTHPSNDFFRAMTFVGVILCLFWISILLYVWFGIDNYSRAHPVEMAELSVAIMIGAGILSILYYKVHGTR